MSFNPDKCEVLRITNKRKNILETDYTIHGSTLHTVDNAKYLGVTFRSNLSWKPHINNITKKANSTLVFLRRNLRKCPSKIKEQAYRTYMYMCAQHWNTPYASSVWDSNIKDQVTQIEKVCSNVRLGSPKLTTIQSTVSLRC